MFYSIIGRIACFIVLFAVAAAYGCACEREDLKRHARNGKPVKIGEEFYILTPCDENGKRREGEND